MSDSQSAEPSAAFVSQLTVYVLEVAGAALVLLSSSHDFYWIAVVSANVSLPIGWMELILIGRLHFGEEAPLLVSVPCLRHEFVIVSADGCLFSCSSFACALDLCYVLLRNIYDPFSSLLSESFDLSFVLMD